MTRNQSNRDEPYSLQPVATALRTVAQGGDALWADQVHTHWKGGYYAPGKGDADFLLRTLFRATRILERGDARQQKQAGDLKRALENVWGLGKAYVVAGEGDIDLTRELREAWGDSQLPPPYASISRGEPLAGEFVNGIAADEAVIDAIVRRLK